MANRFFTRDAENWSPPRGIANPAFSAINIAGIIAREVLKKSSQASIDAAIDNALLDPSRPCS